LALTVIKLAIGSLLLRLMLGLFEVAPYNIPEGLSDTVLAVFYPIAVIMAWAVKYIMIGAIVIVPV
jgi:hypothetical protein